MTGAMSAADRDQQRLQQAAETDDIATMKQLICAGVNTELLGGSLLMASGSNSSRCVTALLLAGAAVNSCSSCGVTPLMRAARRGHLSVVTTLLQHQADVACRSVMGMTVLGVAAAGGQVAVVRALINAGASISDGALSPVLVAAHEGHDEVLSLLLDRGASAKAAARNTGVTPLMACAVGSGDPCTTASLLLARGADPNSVSSGGLTALQLAQHWQLHQLCHLLQPLTSVNTNPHGGAVVTAMDAVCVGDLTALHTILARDPQQATAVGAQGVSPLLAAAVLGKEEAARLLLQCGAHVDDVDALNGWTPLLHALYHRRSEMARLLLRHGADINFVTPKGHTVFDFASEIHDNHIIRAYIRAQSIDDGSSSTALWDTWLSDNITNTDGRTAAQQKPAFKKLWSKVSTRFRKGRSEQELWTGSSIVEDLKLPPTPLIKGQPILPYLPPRPPLHALDLDDEAERDEFVLAGLQACVPMQDVSSTDLNWASDSSLLSHGVLILPPGGDAPPPKTYDRRRVVRHNGPRSDESSGAAEHSSSPCSSLTASSNTTVKTKRYNNLAKHNNSSVSAGEHLTLSLGSRQLHEVLQKLSLTDHSQIFLEQDVDFLAFVELSDEDLQELGVEDTATRSRILAAIRSLRRKL